MQFTQKLANLSTGKKSFLMLTLILLLYIALAPPVSWPLYQFVLFRPVRQTPQTDADQTVIRTRYKAAMTEVVFPSANGKLIHARYFQLPGTNRLFLASEGCGGNIYHRINHAEFLIQCGGSVLQYDYQGYGASEGSPSLNGVCDDATAAYDYLINTEHKKPEDIIAYGESFGTGVTGQLASRRKFGGVILHSGFTSLLRAGRDKYPWLRLYPDSFFPKQIFDNIAVFSRPHAPLLVIHGERDNILSLNNANDLYSKAAEPKTLLTVPDRGHSFFSYHVQNAVADFLQKYSL